jgi:hypothetical protein
MCSASFATRANTGEPQREQKHRLAPGEDSYSEIKSSPEITRYRSSGIRAFAENAVPLARRQRSQWQSRTSPMGPTISNWKPPQRHLPRISFGNTASSLGKPASRRFMYRDLLQFARPGMTRIRLHCIIVDRVDNTTRWSVDCRSGRHCDCSLECPLRPRLPQVKVVPGCAFRAMVGSMSHHAGPRTAALASTIFRPPDIA